MDNLAIKLTEEVESESLAIPERSEAIVINSKESMALADAFKKEIKALIKEIDNTFKPMADKAHQAHRTITGKWNETKQPLLDADQLITKKAKAYLRKAEEERLEEERRLREIAKKEEEDRRLAEALELEKEGKSEEAREVIAEPMQIVTPTVKAASPKLDQRMYRKNWKWRITDMKKIPREYLTTDDIKINGVVRALKDATVIPGIEIYEE